MKTKKLRRRVRNATGNALPPFLPTMLCNLRATLTVYKNVEEWKNKNKEKK